VRAARCAHVTASEQFSRVLVREDRCDATIVVGLSLLLPGAHGAERLAARSDERAASWQSGTRLRWPPCCAAIKGEVLLFRLCGNAFGQTGPGKNGVRASGLVCLHLLVSAGILCGTAVCLTDTWENAHSWTRVGTLAFFPVGLAELARRTGVDCIALTLPGPERPKN
jgi:hypothetical protein